MAKKKGWIVYVPVEVHRLIKLFSGGDVTLGDVIRNAIVEMIEGGEGYVLDYAGGEERVSVKVDDHTHYLLTRLKIELDYKSIGELVHDAVVNYAIRRGLGVECIKQIFNLGD